MQIQKLKLGQQNNDEGSINLAGANKKATLKCKMIKTLAKRMNLSTVTLFFLLKQFLVSYEVKFDSNCCIIFSLNTNLHT